MDCIYCKEPDAYISFSTIQCRNPQCEHYDMNYALSCKKCGERYVCKCKKENQPGDSPIPMDQTMYPGYTMTMNPYYYNPQTAVP